MSRIHKALQKAKETRRELIGDGAKYSPLERINYSISKVIPVSSKDLENQHVVSHSVRDPRAQIFRTLRTNILKQMRLKGWRSIGITSAKPGEGKTLVASNLAGAIAMEINNTSLLVDLDLRNPSVDKFFSLHPEKGMLDYLNGNAEIPELLINPGLERLMILPGKDAAANSAELISSPKMTSLFKELRQRYKSRIIIYDLPAVLPTDDVLTSLNHIDCFLMVIEDGNCSEADLRKSIQILQNGNLLGTVVNKSIYGDSYIDRQIVNQ